jgi:glycine/D-amino acid oxidase-like deaminating enzyme
MYPSWWDVAIIGAGVVSAFALLGLFAGLLLIRGRL